MEPHEKSWAEFKAAAEALHAAMLAFATATYDHNINDRRAIPMAAYREATDDTAKLVAASMQGVRDTLGMRVVESTRKR